jgi:hypothetical protein
MDHWVRLDVENINSIHEGDLLVHGDLNNETQENFFPVNSVYVIKHISSPQFGEVYLESYTKELASFTMMSTKKELVSQGWWWLSNKG